MTFEELRAEADLIPSSRSDFSNLTGYLTRLWLASEKGATSPAFPSYTYLFRESVAR